MISILIVDDEKNIRAGIHKILSESIRYPVRFLEAKNGLEALEIARESSPDLVITDIRMPKMDGVALMKEISGGNRKPVIVVLSGFDDFTYAQNAIRYGAVSYILKPVDRNELIATVTKAMARIEADRKRTVEAVVRKTIEDGRAGRVSLPGGFSFREPFRYAIAAAPGGGAALGSLDLGAPWYVVERKSESLGLVVRDDRVEEFVRAVAVAGGRAGLSAPCSSAANLRAARRQAEIALLGRFFDAETRVFFHAETDVRAGRPGAESAAQKLSLYVGAGNAAGLTEALDALFDFGSPGTAEGARELYALRELLDAVFLRKYREQVESDAYLTLKGIMLENAFQFETLGAYRAAVGDFAVYLDTILRKGHGEYPFVSEAIDYIRAHFTEDINMTVVANHVSVNYTYFSEKFKEHTGINFNDYLKNLRLAEAKRLLEKGCYKVYEVAENAGFGDVKYFMKTFKENTGVSPGEYRKQF